MRPFKLLSLVPVLLFFGCATTSPTNPAKSLSTLDITQSATQVSLQKAKADCGFESGNFIPMSHQKRGGIFRGFLEREIYGNCMNSKGFKWGRP